MFEIKEYTPEEYQTYWDVAISFALRDIECWANNRGIDLTQEQAEEMAEWMLNREDGYLNDDLNWYYDFCLEKDTKLEVNNG